MRYYLYSISGKEIHKRMVQKNGTFSKIKQKSYYSIYG
jgi:hypothetical protein